MRTDETVREVCAEMQDARHLSKSAIEDGNHLLSDWYYDDECQGWLSYFSNRLLSAYEREIAAKDAEIARLKSELCYADGRMNTLSLDMDRLKVSSENEIKKKDERIEILAKAHHYEQNARAGNLIEIQGLKKRIAELEFAIRCAIEMLSASGNDIRSLQMEMKEGDDERSSAR